MAIKNTLINASTSVLYLATLLDETKTLVEGQILSTLTLSLIDATTQAVVNGRADQNVLNANDVTVYDTLQNGVDADGKAVTYNLQWLMTPADTAILDETHSSERRTAIFSATWGGGRQMEHPFTFTVVRIPTV